MKIKLNGNDWYRLTADFGEVSDVHSSGHSGIDLGYPAGTEIYSPTDGVIKNVVDFGDKNVGRGIYIGTEEDETIILGHLSEIGVEKGQEVKFGELIGLSGSTGRSTGAHLHVGLKGSDGRFIDPSKYMEREGVHRGGVDRGGRFGGRFADRYNDLSEEIDIDIEYSDGVKGFFEFMDNVKEHGLSYAIYGKSFFEVTKGFLAELFKDMGVFILGNGDIFFLLPAVTLMIGTFVVGRNKYTKWILPLWFTYFVSSVFHKMLILK